MGITKDTHGKIVWLETGNSLAGLQHILQNHTNDFNTIGVAPNKIPDLILCTVSNTKPIGYVVDAKNQRRDVFEVQIAGKGSKMKHIKLMAEYACHPLWLMDDPHYLGDIDPRDLPLSEETLLQLEHWLNILADTAVWDDPARSGFKTKEEEDRWDQEGVLLWKKLQQELGASYQVDFFFHDNVFTNLNEFERAYPGQYQAQESPYSSIVLKEKRRTYIYTQSDKQLPMHE